MVNVKTWATEEKCKANGFTSIESFMTKRRGRPKKKKRILLQMARASGKAATVANQNRPSAKRRKKVIREADQQKATTISAVAEKKGSRTNWSKGENAKILAKAVGDWLEKKGDAVDANGESVQLKPYSVIVGIPYRTLVSYTKEDPSKRRQLGAATGPSPILDTSDTKFMSDVLRRADRGNEGMSRAEAINTIQELVPGVSKQTGSRLLTNHILRNVDNKGLLKSNLVVAQATTTKRSAITLQQQWRWHTTVDNALDQMREKNQGTCKLTGKTFGELIGYFIIGGDEACFMANAKGDGRVIGSADIKKQEKNFDDCRASITAYRTGTAKGDQGPTGFLLKGDKTRHGYSNKFLEKHGAAHGSQIIMTESAFMTTVAWEKMTPMLMRGYRKINKYVEANPDWWCLEILDGFGAHFNSHYAMKERQKNRIISLKEEGNSSHVNQAYDRHVAKIDKQHAANFLSFLRKFRFRCGSVLDQWHLIHVVLGALKAAKPSTWVSSFKACNLYPETRVPFQEWCKKIEPFLQKGGTFKTETTDDKYLLLPDYWHAILPDNKKKIFNLVKSEGGFTAECVRKLSGSEYSIRTKDMHSLRVCYEVAMENPDHLEREVPTKEDLERLNGENGTNPEIEAAKLKTKKITHGLNSFLLKPEELKGEALLNHMIKFRKTHGTENARSLSTSPSMYLAIDVDATQASLLNPCAMDLNQRAIIECAGGDGARLKLAKRRLDNLGFYSSDCGIQNDPGRLDRLKNQLELSASLAEIKNMAMLEDENATEMIKKYIKKCTHHCKEIYQWQESD